MLRAVLIALTLGQAFASNLCAEPSAFDDPPADLVVLVHFHVPGPERRYGLLLQAPKIMSCTLVRYQIDGAGAPRVSIGLAAGEMAMVRLRGPLQPGRVELAVTPLGCAAKPGLARRVMFGRASPDHGWRAGHTAQEGQRAQAEPALGDRKVGPACGTPLLGWNAGARNEDEFSNLAYDVPCG